MEIIADLHTKKGVIHLHFHAWGIPSDGFTWSPDCTKEEKLEVLKEFREYLTAEIEGLENSRLTPDAADKPKKRRPYKPTNVDPKTPPTYA
jgi:hypothetical protein